MLCITVVERQLAMMLVPMRQKLLAIPSKIGSRFRNAQQIREIVEFTDQMCKEALNDIANLPAAAEPDWLERLEKDKDA